MKMQALILSFVIAYFGALPANAGVPKLSSYPAASAVLFLDFDGHTVYGTAWNYNGPIACAPAALDSAKITQVFNRVAEDYRPFNINITTDSTVFLAAPIDQRMRVILTVSSDWYGSAGGVAFVNSFTSGDDTPCFIFTALLNNNVKYIAEAASHEAGHTLGLFHQSNYDANCNKLTDYYQGTGTGEIGWAPIMGVGYYRNLTLWNSGPTPYGCESIQNDLEVITSDVNDFGYRADDHGNDFPEATVASFSGNEFSIQGVIERNTDNDIFRFTVPASGRIQVNAIPYNVGTGNAGSNLDLQVSLYNSPGQLINVYNPGTLLSSVIDTTLAAGSYYLKVEGRGNAFAPEYASLGSYSLRALAAPGTVLPVHRLELRGFLNGANHELRWIIEADEAVVEQYLEASIDERNFQSLAERPADVRAYNFQPSHAGSAQYRLKVILADGRQYYSNVAHIRQSTSDRPMLVGNVIRSGTIVASSPAMYNYSIIDLSGKILTHGQLTRGINNITFHPPFPGLYLIMFEGGNDKWSEKFTILQ